MQGAEMKKVLKFDRPSGPRVLSTILLSHRLRGEGGASAPKGERVRRTRRLCRRVVFQGAGKRFKALW